MSPWSATAVASSSETASGTCSACPASTTTSSAYDPGASVHTTRSPTANPSTPSPTSATTPAPSLPTTCGYSIAYTPERLYVSMKFTPATAERTRSCPGPGDGSGSSVYSRTSGPPAARATIACMASA